jgi:hypothetical protein
MDSQLEIRGGSGPLVVVVGSTLTLLESRRRHAPRLQSRPKTQLQVEIEKRQFVSICREDYSKSLSARSRDCLPYRGVRMVFPFGDVLGCRSRAGRGPQKVSSKRDWRVTSPTRSSRVNITNFTRQCTLPQLPSPSLGDNGRTFPSQTSAEGQEDEQWQRSLLGCTFHSQPCKLKLQSTSIPSRSFPLAGTQLGVAMGDLAIDIDGSGLVQMGSWLLGIFGCVGN